MGMIQQATTDAGAVLAVVCLALSFSATDAWSSYYSDDDDYGYSSYSYYNYYSYIIDDDYYYSSVGSVSGAIVGAVIGGVCLCLCCCAAGVYFFWYAAGNNAGANAAALPRDAAPDGVIIINTRAETSVRTFTVPCSMFFINDHLIMHGP